MTDDDRLRSRLRALDGVGPSPGLLDRARQWGPRRAPVGQSKSRRIIVMMTAFAVFGASAVLVLQAFDGTGTVPGANQHGAAPGMLVYANQVGLPLSLDYPSVWFAQSIIHPADAVGPHQLGVIVANTSSGMPSSNTAAPTPGPLSENPTLPPDFVRLTILTNGDGQPDPAAVDSPLPLSMNDAKHAPGPVNIRSISATVSGIRYEISIQGGPQASAADLATADQIVSSIRSPNKGPTLAATQLTGIAFPVCDVTYLRSDVTGDGEPDGLYIFSRAATDGTCPATAAKVAYVGLRPGDVGPIVTDTNVAVRCNPICRVLATPSLGSVKLFAVRASAYTFALFRVPAHGAPLTPLVTTPPQPGGQLVAYFPLGGAGPDSVAGFVCLPGGQVESWSAALTVEGNGPYLVDQTTYALRGHVLARVSNRRSSVPQTDVAALPQSGGIAFGSQHVLCASPLVSR